MWCMHFGQLEVLSYILIYLIALKKNLRGSGSVFIETRYSKLTHDTYQTVQKTHI